MKRSTENLLKMKSREDNGLELCSKLFNNFCRNEGISRHFAIPNTLQQNGLTKRMNIASLERLRCMLLGAGLSTKFWEETLKIAYYLVHRSLSSALGFKTSMEMWTSYALNYIRMRVFGCAAYTYTRQDKQQPGSLKCVFLGYL